jgi:uncharacterized membrane protein
MNLRFYIICTAVLLALGVYSVPTLGVPFFPDSNVTATVHGATYASDTLELLNDTVINVNSNPPQSMVAKDGTYSFELVPGEYTITARYYQNSTLIFSKETDLKIEEEGNYVFDLLLYPVSENQVKETIADNTNDLNIANPTEQTRTYSLAITYLPIALALFLLLGGSYKFSRGRKKMEKDQPQEKLRGKKLQMPVTLTNILGKSAGFGVTEPESVGRVVSITESVIEPVDNSEIETAAPGKIPLSTDLSKVLSIIRDHKGRITQKDLRNRLEYSEVKVSLMLSELEKRGLVKKLKNGRENIVILADVER